MTRFAVVCLLCGGCDALFGLHHGDPASGDAPRGSADAAHAIDAAPADASTCFFGSGSGAGSGSDLDGDGMPDSCDPCIAAAQDGLLDFDGDHELNAADPCPWDNPDGSDADHDGVAAACDPHPGPIDHQRCVMVFSDGGLNGKLWAPLGPEPSWSLGAGMLEGNASLGTAAAIVATESIEGDGTTSYDAVIELAGNNITNGTLSMFVRAGDSARLGCRLSLQPSGDDLMEVFDNSGALSDKAGLYTPVQSSPMRIRFRASVTPAASSTSVDCFAAFASTSVATNASFTGAPIDGTMGFETNSFDAQLVGLDVIDQ